MCVCVWSGNPAPFHVRCVSGYMMYVCVYICVCGGGGGCIGLCMCVFKSGAKKNIFGAIQLHVGCVIVLYCVCMCISVGVCVYMGECIGGVCARTSSCCCCVCVCVCVCMCVCVSWYQEEDL